MQVNSTIYPVVESTTDFDFTKNVGEYTLNDILDESIVYSSSSSGYADLQHKTVYNWRTTYGQRHKIIADNATYNYQRKILARQTSGGIFSYATNNDDYTQNNNYRFGYDASETNAYYMHNELVRAFKYFSVCGCIYVEYFTTDGYETVARRDLKTYFESFSDKKINRILFTVYSGTNTSRNYTNIQFIDYMDFVIPYFTVPSQNDETIFDVNYDNIINYFPHHSSASDNAQIGGTILGCPRPTGRYQTTAITLQIAGSNFYRANNSNVNWDNVTDISYSSQYPTFYPEITLDRNEILHMAATYGIMFTDTENIAKTYNFTDDTKLSDDHVYMPVLESNKLWQGNFTSGSSNLTNPIKEWNNDKNAPFVNGSPPISGNTPIFGDDSLTNHAGNTSALTHRYLLNNAKMQTISTYLNNIDDNLLTAIVNNIRMSGDSPINSVVSVQYIPFDISTYAPAVSDVIVGSNLINIGTLESPVALSANVVTADSIIIDLGECNIVPVNDNFLDYEPYTKYLCYIPYCNFVELDAGIIVNRKLTFQLVCDLVGGTCEGIIRVNGRMYKSVSGVFATQCSVQGIDSSNYVNSLMSSAGKYVSGVGTMIAATAGVATGNVSTALAVTGLVAGAGTAASGLYEYSTTPKQFEASGKSVGLIGQRLPQHVCLYRYYCQDISDENFKDFAGYACEFTAQLSSLSGYTQCGNVNLSGIVATNEEKEIIKNILETGFYI